MRITMEYFFFILCVVVGVGFFKYGISRITIFGYERGLRYDKGKFTSVLEAGQYWYAPYFTTIQKMDVRPRFVSISGQEVLSNDGVTLKVSLAAKFEITDPDIAVNKISGFQEALYLELQLALREIIGSADVDTILDARQDMGSRLLESTEAKAADLGLKLHSVNLKDIMFPGKLKEMFAKVVSAKKEGVAALEKARGETAALRSLANAAKMLENNPQLLQLRLLQAVGESSGNNLILGVPSQLVPINEVNVREKNSE